MRRVTSHTNWLLMPNVVILNEHLKQSHGVRSIRCVRLFLRRQQPPRTTLPKCEKGEETAFVPIGKHISWDLQVSFSHFFLLPRRRLISTLAFRWHATRSHEWVQTGVSNEFSQGLCQQHRPTMSRDRERERYLHFWWHSFFAYRTVMRWKCFFFLSDANLLKI